MPSKTAGASLHPYTAKNSRRVVPLLPTPLRLSFIDGKVHITPAGVNDTTVNRHLHHSHCHEMSTLAGVIHRDGKVHATPVHVGSTVPGRA
eukprot:1136703-Pelagomonas_calceolata.AAC.7